MRWGGAIVATLALAPAAGADEARYFIPAAVAARVEAGERSGLWVELESAPSGLTVTVSEAVRALSASPAFPLEGTERCGDPAALEVPAGFALPAALERLRARRGSAIGVARAAVAYVSERTALDENDAGSQDGVSVLRRGRGRCSGRANLAIGLLRALGVPARAVHGMVVGGAGARYHRWGEAWLGAIGWVPFDPGAAVGLVSVRYVPLSGAAEGLALDGVRALAVDERGFLGLTAWRGLRLLPARGATLRCVAPSSAAPLAALLVGPDGSRWAREGRGELVFTGMLPGRYRILWSSNGESAVRDFVLGSGDVRLEVGGKGATRS